MPVSPVSRTRKLFLAIIAKNESARIEATIQSAKSFVDQIYVLDSGSSDDTREIVTNSGAKIFESSWSNDFSALRNELLEEIEKDAELGDFVLWMNAGELFDTRTVEQFARFTESQLDPESAYFLVIRRALPENGETLAELMHSNDAFRNGSRSEREEEIIELRLLPLRQKIRYSGRLRESVFLSVQESGVKLNALPGRILRLSPLLDVKGRERRAKRTLEIIEAAKANNEPLSDEMLLERAEAILWLGNPVASREFYREILETTESGNIALEAFYRIDDTFRAERNTSNEPLENLGAGIEKFPRDLQLLSLLGGLLQQRKQFEIAIRTMETAVKYGQLAFDVWHRWRVRNTIIRNLGLTFRMFGEYDRALELFEEYFEEVKDDPEIVRNMVDLYILKGEEEKGTQTAKLLWNGAELEVMEKVITGASRASRNDWEGAKQPLSEAFEAGNRDVLCLRWYSLVLLSSCKFEEARPVLEEWRKYDIENIEPRAFLFASRFPERFSEILNLIGNTDIESLINPSEANGTGAIPQSLELIWESMINPMKTADTTNAEEHSLEEEIDFDMFEIDSAGSNRTGIKIR